jgi:hypothetical protein
MFRLYCILFLSAVFLSCNKDDSTIEPELKYRLIAIDDIPVNDTLNPGMLISRTAFTYDNSGNIDSVLFQSYRADQSDLITTSNALVVRHTANKIILSAASGSDFGNWIADTLHLNAAKAITKISVVGYVFPFGIVEDCLQLRRDANQLISEKIRGGCIPLGSLMDGYHQMKYVNNHLVSFASFPPDTTLESYVWNENFSYEIDYFPENEFDIIGLQIWNQSDLPFRLSNRFFNSTYVAGKSILGVQQTKAVKSVRLKGDFAFLPNYELEYTYEYVKDSKNRISRAFLYSKNNVTPGDRRLAAIKAFVYEEE